MKHMPCDKYTIAWFKLAEFVSRGEKEKALGIYKLLAISIDDPAFINKLEGDILFAFNDKLASERYYKSAILYQNNKNLIEAGAIFENLININPESIEFLYKLVQIYKELNFVTKLAFALKRLFLAQINRNEINNAIETLNQLELENTEIHDFYEIVTFRLIDNNVHSDLVLKYINKAMDSYFSENKKQEMQQFLTKLELVNKSYYNDIIKNINIKKTK